jgi:hypothetical protein
MKENPVLGRKRMSHPRFNSKEVVRRGEELYAQKIRSQVETEANIGKLVSIDIETGDYEIGTDDSLEAPRRLHTKHPGAAVYTKRIGYNAVYTLGGVLERTTS